MLIASITISLAALATAPAAWADRDDDYQEGVVAYNDRRYRTAIELFQKSLHAGNSNPICMLYLAHSYSAQGLYQSALPIYRNIRDQFKGTAESDQAAMCVNRLEELISRGGQSAIQPAAAGGNSPAADSAKDASHQKTEPGKKDKGSERKAVKKTPGKQAKNTH
jgi:tetratricopeptide (TPR) repeat protein